MIPCSYILEKIQGGGYSYFSAFGWRRKLFGLGKVNEEIFDWQE